MRPRYKYLNRTTLLCVFFGAVLCGLGSSKLWGSGLHWTFLGVVIGVFVVSIFMRRRLVLMVAILALGLSVGIWRGGSYLNMLKPYSHLTGQKVVIQVTADSSAVYARNAQLEFEASHIRMISPYQAQLPGRMVISGFGERSVLRGDVVIVEGKMHNRRGGKIAGIGYAQLEVVSRSSSVVETLRRDFLAGLATSLPEPHDQFAAGLLVGQRSDMPEDVTDTLRTVGLSHIIAVSGYNLTIMAELARRRFGKKSQFRKLFFSVVFVLMFVALAGSSASITRAAYVSLLTIVAAYYGRSVKPHLLLLLVAAATAFIQPLNIWVDIGWYLSFLAFFGVLLLAPALTKKIYGKKEPKLLARLIIETSCAQIATLPLILYIFHDMSIISLVANLLIVPFVPLAMLLSFIAGVSGMILPLWALAIGFPARVLLESMLGVSSLLSRVPHATVQVSLGLGAMLSIYASIVVVLLSATRKTLPKNGILIEK